MIENWIPMIFMLGFFYLVLGLCTLLVFDVTATKVIRSPNACYLNEAFRHRYWKYAVQNRFIWLIVAIWPLALIFAGAYYLGLALYYRYIAKGNCEIYIHAWVNQFLKKQQR